MINVKLITCLYKINDKCQVLTYLYKINDKCQVNNMFIQTISDA